MKIKKIKVEITFHDSIELNKNMNLTILENAIQNGLSCDSYGISKQTIFLANIKRVKILDGDLE